MMKNEVELCHVQMFPAFYFLCEIIVRFSPFLLCDMRLLCSSGDQFMWLLPPSPPLLRTICSKTFHHENDTTPGVLMKDDSSKYNIIEASSIFIV